MFYYTTDGNGKIIHYCSNVNIAAMKVKKGEWKSFFKTDEEIIMQGDGSGYVLLSQYVAPDTRLEDLTKEYNDCVSQLKDYIAEAHLLADNELIQDIQNEYAEITKTYDEQTAEILNEV